MRFHHQEGEKMVKNKFHVGMILTIAIGLSLVMPAIMALSPGDDSETQYYFIQFDELPSSQLRTAMESSGIEFQEYYQNGIYLVKIIGQPSDNALIARYASSLEPYTADMKISQQVMGIDEPANVKVLLHDGVDVEATVSQLEAMGITIHKINTDSINYIRCAMDFEDIIQTSMFEDVKFIDVDPEPITFMNLISSNTYLGIDTPQSFGYTGNGMLAEVQDNGIDIGHPDLANIIYTDGAVVNDDHGTCTSGIVFGNGAGDIDALGVANQATGVFSDWYTGRATSVSNLWAGTFNEGNAGMNGVVQSNSWSQGIQDGLYQIYANENDQAAIDNPHVLTFWATGNGNDGTGEGQLSEDAISKNAMGIGAIFHKNTAVMTDDEWLLQAAGNTPSRGPAADGRQKPDMAGCFDWIYTVDNRVGGYAAGDYYSNFGGTSGATPIVAGSALLAYDMYEDNFFDNNPTNQLPYSSTIKALMIANAFQYDLADATRNEQGWGTPDMENMYNLGATYHQIDEYPQAMDSGSFWTRDVLSDGTEPLKITLCWTDPAAPSSTNAARALINNLDLKVISPGGVEYYGNNGLWNNLYSTSGTGANQWGSDHRDDLNNLENVFIQNPQIGTWTIEITGRTGDVAMGPQDFSLVSSGALIPSPPPEATVDYPTVANLIETDGTVDITWTVSDGSPWPNGGNVVNLSYSDDGGASWTPIANNQNVNSDPWAWDVSSLADGVNYLVNVSAYNSGSQEADDESDFPFSIDNVADDEWFFQFDGPFDLDMKPVENSPNIVASAGLTAPGQYQIGIWETPGTYSDSISGDWTFNVYGFVVDPGTLDAYIYAIVKDGSGSILDITVNDDENIGLFTASHMFTWTDTLAGTVSANTIRVEIWLNVITGSGGSGGTLTYVPNDPEFTATYWDVNGMPPEGVNLNTEYAIIAADVSVSDDTRFTTIDPAAWDEIFVWNEVTVSPDPATITQIDMTFEGQGFAATDFDLWALGAGGWAATGDTITCAAGTDGTLTGSITVTPGDYIIGGVLTWGVYQTDDSDLIRIDFLETVITYALPTPVFNMEYDYGTTQSSVLPYIGPGSDTPYDIPIPVTAAADDWVFISFAYVMSGPIEVVLDDTVHGGGGTTWDVAKWYDPQDDADPWKTHRIGAPNNDLVTIDHTMGVWLHLVSHDGGTLSTGITGDYSAGAVLITLEPGWNMVGYPSSTPRDAAATLPIGADFIAVYNGALSYLIEDFPVVPGAVTMSEGNGYWVHAIAIIIWFVDP